MEKCIDDKMSFQASRNAFMSKTGHCMDNLYTCDFEVERLQDM